VHFILVFITIN